MICFLRLGADCLNQSIKYPSMRAAIEAFAEDARSLARWGQRLEASIHFGRSIDEIAEYPDRLLWLTDRGVVRVERT